MDWIFPSGIEYVHIVGTRKKERHTLRKRKNSQRELNSQTERQKIQIKAKAERQKEMEIKMNEKGRSLRSCCFEC